MLYLLYKNKNVYLKISVSIHWLLTHISLASFKWDIDKQNSTRCDAAKRGVPSEAILFALLNFIEKWIKNEKLLPKPLKRKVGSSNL